jgi:Beta-1,4-xylanase
MKASLFRRAAFAACALALGAAQAAFGADSYASNFSEGTQGWHGRGKESVSVDATKSHGGSASLKVSGRSATWNGPQHALAEPISPGSSYHVSAWIMYDQGPASLSFSASVELGWADTAVSHQYKNVASIKAAKGAWTKVEYDYLVPSDKNLAVADLYFETAYKSDSSATSDDLVDFYLSDVVVAKLDASQKAAAQEDIPSLGDALSDYFPVGAAVSPDLIDRANPHYRLLQRQYSALVAGNAMKPDALQPREGEFHFEGADRIVTFASMTGKTMRGHTLVWHNQTPAWFFQDPNDPAAPASPELLMKRLDSHIANVAGHFAGDVAAWDVVNEVLNEDGTLRASKWLNIAGPGYIERAFRDARAADPDAELFINDYNLESSQAKREGMYALVKDLRERGAPVDGVGLQMHISMYDPPVAEIRETIEKFASLGVKVEVTELDVSIYRGDEASSIAVTPALLRAQADRYAELFDLFKAEAKKGNLDMVVLWGCADDDSWLDDFPVAGRQNAALLFDRKLQAKPAYWAIVDPSKLK